MRFGTEIGLIALLAALLLTLMFGTANFFAKPQSASCAVQLEEREVRGTSLRGVINPGASVTIGIGHYACHNVQRDDVVVFENAQGNLVIKIVRGLPGDRFDIRQTNKVWNIILNGTVLTTSSDEPYRLDDRGRLLMQVYRDSYGGVIPTDTYFVLGNLPGGSYDSTQIGLISKTEFIGKVLQVHE